MRRLTKPLAALAGLATLAAGAPAVGASGRAHRTPPGSVVTDWNSELLTILATPGAQPATVHPTRSLAILHVAMYDAVVSITHGDRPYLFEVDASRRARPEAAADQAAHDVLVALYPTMAPALDSKLADELATVPAGASTEEGIRVGHTVATLMLAARAGDGSADTPPAFTLPSPAPGVYQPTPPNQAAPAFTNWSSVAPFVIDAADQFRPVAPPDLASAQWAEAINEVQALGQDSSTQRTPDQTEIGRFWAPPIWITWNEIADRQISLRHTGLEQAAKAEATLNLAFADSAIAMYDAKYHYLFWRPITAIRAGTPGNPAVTAHPDWNALTATAPDPSYPGAHSTISAAGAAVLTRFFGPHVRLDVGSDALPGVVRHFSSFAAVAKEAGLSRIYAGQHTRLDDVAGQRLGHDVATLVLQRT